MPDFYFRQLYDTRHGALTYVLGDTEQGEAIVIDPLAEDSLLLGAMLQEQGLRLRWILHTHLHHGLACNDLKTGHVYSRQITTELRPADVPEGIHLVDHNDQISFGQQSLRVIATPGHTPNSISFLWRDRLFCGDALHLGGCPPCNDPHSDPGAMYDSVTTQLLTLPGETLVFPGHDLEGRSVATIAEERRRNKAFSGRSRDAFMSFSPEFPASPSTPDPSTSLPSTRAA
jgi:glyoxylase-like metal-dependent hydrolase (beta-lactamase superfamily II)